MRTEIQTLAALALVAVSLGVTGVDAAPGKEGGYTMHTVFSAECTPYFDVSRSTSQPIERLNAMSLECKRYQYTF